MEPHQCEGMASDADSSITSDLGSIWHYWACHIRRLLDAGGGSELSLGFLSDLRRDGDGVLDSLDSIDSFLARGHASLPAYARD